MFSEEMEKRAQSVFEQNARYRMLDAPTSRRLAKKLRIRQKDVLRICEDQGMVVTKPVSDPLTHPSKLIGDYTVCLE
jgi:hypothetical protein